MARLIFIHIAAFLAALSLSACSTSSPSPGPTTWIDQPLDGARVPLGALTVQAHASDADGIATIEFHVSGTLSGAVNVDGGRLGNASIEWMPPGEGNYTIDAFAIDSQGNAGPTKSVHIVVGSASPTVTTPTPASQCAAEALVAPALLSPADGATVGADPLLAWSYPGRSCHPHSYRVDISEDASFADIGWGFGTLDYNETSRRWPLPSGKCYYWRVLAYVPDVNGPASPVWTFCIEGATTVPAPSPAAPEAEPTPPATTAPDSTPPDISSVSADPAIISVQAPCGATPATTLIRARVTDAGGIARVYARVPGVGEFEMSPAGDGYYQVTLGPFGDAGTLSIFVQAQDSAGNTATGAPIEVQVVACPE